MDFGVYEIAGGHAAFNFVMKDKPQPVTMNLRVTELFRRFDGEWKLFHRHADLLQEG